MRSFRILVVDDNLSIHEDFKKILLHTGDKEKLNALKKNLFGTQPKKPIYNQYRIDAAAQGIEAFKMVQESIAAKDPYALAFVDILMPPGWDGIQTIKEIWQADPDMQIVICTAYADYSWEEIIGELGYSDNFLILKKPFDNIEIHQLAACLTQKWFLSRQVGHQFDKLQEKLARNADDLRSL